MDCLQNIIGIKGCGAPEGAELFVNDLPGINIENVEALMGESDDSYLETWRKVQLRVIKKFPVAVKSKLNQTFRISDHAVVECLICAQPELFEAALWYLHGVEMMIERTSSDAVNRFTTVDLDKAERLKAEFYSEYETALQDAVKSINPHDTDCITECEPCREAIKFVTQLP